jgi:electron transport complex protein RnfB
MVEKNISSEVQDINIYRKLQGHLDKLPIGFPATKSGVELKLLTHFFTTEEAEVALFLKWELQSVDEIYENARELNLTKQELENKLDNIARKGSIRFAIRNGKKMYGTDILAVGMYEAKVNHLSEEFLNDLMQYNDEAFGVAFIGARFPQMRTVPVEKSITPEHHIPTYEEVAKIIEDIEGPIALYNCICRQAHDLMGDPCKQTTLRENCMGFGPDVQFSIDIGRGREISKTEALDVLRKNQEDGLVLQAANSLKPNFICSCCSCCCGVLQGVGALPRPIDFMHSNYYAEVDEELCVGCGTCQKRCQMNAIKIKNDIAKVLTKRCIGCGNCAAVCPEGAMQLKRKEAELIPPQDSEELYNEILKRKQAIKGE